MGLSLVSQNEGIQKVVSLRKKSPTLRSNMGDNQTSVVVLNDQGGQQMEITHDKTGTLRAQEHGHQPIIACGFDGNAGAQSGSTGFTVEGGYSRSRENKACSCYQKTVVALCAADSKGVGSQYVYEGKLIVDVRNMWKR